MRSRSPRATVVTVGEELLSGATLDRNAAWISARLGEVGIPVWRTHSVGDRDDDITEVVRSASRASQLVVVTGGLGPTSDDRTRDAVAAALGSTLVEDPALLRWLQDRNDTSGRGRLSPEMRALALRPREGRVLPNPVGVAPGLAFPSRGPTPGWVVALPGVPREMRAIFGSVAELVQTTFGGALRSVRSRLIHTTGIPESQLAPRVESALAGVAPEVELAFLPDLVGVDLRLTVRLGGGDDGRGAERLLDAAEAALSPVLAGHTFRASSGDLVEATMARLEARRWTFATAESCTGGLVAERYTSRSGASATFRGAIVAYANDVKTTALGVPHVVLEEHGAVSEKVALHMAEAACERLGADCSVSITGIAGPGGGSEEKPVGTVWIAACLPGPDSRVVVARHHLFTGDREAVRVRAAQAALHLLFVQLDTPPGLEGLARPDVGDSTGPHVIDPGGPDVTASPGPT